MKPDKLVTATEILDELWKFYFAFVKGLLLVLTVGANLLAMVAFFVAQRAFYGSAWAKSFVESWVPVRPAIFDLGK